MLSEGRALRRAGSLRLVCVLQDSFLEAVLVSLALIQKEPCRSLLGTQIAFVFLHTFLIRRNLDLKIYLQAHTSVVFKDNVLKKKKLCTCFIAPILAI